MEGWREGQAGGRAGGERAEESAGEAEQLLALGVSRAAWPRAIYPLTESSSISSLHRIASPHGLESSSYTSAWVAG